MYECIYVYVHKYANMYVFMYVRMFVCVCVYVFFTNIQHALFRSKTTFFTVEYSQYGS
jgi:hypothetical protein